MEQKHLDSAVSSDEEVDYQEFEAQLQAVLAIDPVERIQAYEALIDDLENDIHDSRDSGENP